jgi:hypothetical protein
MTTAIKAIDPIAGDWRGAAMQTSLLWSTPFAAENLCFSSECVASVVQPRAGDRYY